MNVLNKPFLNIKTYQYIINELFGKTRKREKKREREREKEREVKILNSFSIWFV